MTTEQSWAPTPEDATDVVPEGAVTALHGLFDAEGDPPAAGEPLPPLWHWLAFLPRAPQRDIGPDGHPKRGSFMPPVSLPRRLFAGGRLAFHGPVAVNEPLHRHSNVVSVEEKSGRSGDLVFVRVSHELSTNGGSAVTEEQDIVYRGAGPPGAATSPSTEPSPDDWEWRWDLGIDPVVLFRFSALTYNAHRIHYDRPYAIDVEGYPGLVVHGPLQAVALAELCRRHMPGRPLATFRFRSVGPAFDDGPLRLRGRPVDDGARMELAAFSADGRLSMSAEAS